MVNRVTRLIERNLIWVIVLISAFARLYRLNLLLGFWYDQGRDALVIWNLLHYGKFFLIGPVTGIDGIYLGPFYYYLLTPFYWLGQGNPVYPAVGLSLLGTASVYLTYWLGKQVFGRRTGLVAALMYGFSFEIITSNRWLSNPNPLPFFTLLLWVFLWRFIKGKETSLVLAVFLLGLCLQLEAAAATFFIPSLLLIVWLYRKNIKSWLVVVEAFFAFILTLLPQVIFNFRHQNVLVKAFYRFLVSEKSFSISFLQTISDRLVTYFEVIFRSLFPEHVWLGVLLLASFSASVIIYRKKVITASSKSLWLWVIVPLVCYFFYHGNNGYFWGYYLIGIVPIAFILIASTLSSTLDNHFLRWPVIAVLVIFVYLNLTSVSTYLRTGIGITLGSQKKAIDWVYRNADRERFNYDAYVPPNIYYAYSYLFMWYGQGRYGYQPSTELLPLLYTLAEPDDQHPAFLAEWRKRQDSIGIITDSYFWGDITVERRQRISYE